MALFRKIIKKPDPEKEEQLRREINEAGGLEKKDLPAMIISAYLVIIPIAVGVLLLMYFLARLILRI